MFPFESIWTAEAPPPPARVRDGAPGAFRAARLAAAEHPRPARHQRRRHAGREATRQQAQRAVAEAFQGAHPGLLVEVASWVVPGFDVEGPLTPFVIAFGLVWFYEGLVPKIWFVRRDEIGLVHASHLVRRTPELTQSRQTESGLSRDDSLVASCAIISRIRPMFEGNRLNHKNAGWSFPVV